MSNRDQNQEFWQKKRNELPVNPDAQPDWGEMQSLLDEHMPVSNSSAGGSSASNLAKFRYLYVVSGLIVAGLIAYFAINYKNESPVDKNHKTNKTEIRRDSIAASSASSINNSGDVSKLNDNSASHPADGSGANTDKLLNAGSKNSTVVATDKSKNGTALSGKNTAGMYNGNNGDRNSGNKHLLSSAGSLNSNKGFIGNNRQSNRRSGRNQHNQSNSLVSNEQQRTNSNLAHADGETIDNDSQILQYPPAPLLTWDDVVANSLNQPKTLKSPFALIRKLSADKKTKAAKQAHENKFDWGLLISANTNGTFTPKAQNTNFYGSLPVDIYPGLFITYNVNNKWAIGLQGTFLNPHTSYGSYTYTHSFKVYALQFNQEYQIENSRKAYTIDVPLHLIYKVTPNFNVKAGPLLSLPIKDFNRITLIHKDSTAYVDTLISKLRSVNYERKLRGGVSVGAGFNYKFLRVDATYNYYPQAQKVSSELGTFKANTNNLQITVGIKLNKSKQ